MQRTLTDEEKNREEVRYWRGQTWAAVAQIVIALISIVAVIIAGTVAWESYQTSKYDARTALLQSEDSQLSAAIDALGASSTGERVAGLVLLTRNTERRFTEASQSGEQHGDVYADYTTALQALSGYLSSQSEALFTALAKAGVKFGRGYGVTSLSDQAIDLYYAADQVRNLLAADMESKVAALHSHRQPGIDLSHDELFGASWIGVNFSWVRAFMEGIDLRDVDLAGSRWGGQADLRGAYLQCADLTGAHFQGADLRNANLNGADVQGADFRGAQIKLPGPTVVYGTAKWSRVPPGLTVLPLGSWNPQFCVGTYIAPETQSTLK